MSTLLQLRPVLHADETPVRQLAPGKGKTKRHSKSLDEESLILVFDYRGGRGGVPAQTFLGDWCGHMMVDDYSGYKALFVGCVTELTCLVRGRRQRYGHGDKPALNRPTLIRYADSGTLQIDNNPLENPIRPITLTRIIGYLRARSALVDACSHPKPAGQN